MMYTLMKLIEGRNQRQIRSELLRILMCVFMMSFSSAVSPSFVTDLLIRYELLFAMSFHARGALYVLGALYVRLTLHS